MRRRDILKTGAIALAGAGAPSCQAAVPELTPEMLRRLHGALKGNRADVVWLEQQATPKASLVLWGERYPLAVGGAFIDPSLERLRVAIRQLGEINDISLRPGKYLADENSARVLLPGGSGYLWITCDTHGHIVEIGAGEGAVYTGTMSVVEFGARGDGSLDDNAAISNAYQALVRRGGGTLLFPPGHYRLNLTLTSRVVNLRGAGNGLSVLEPADVTRPILQAEYTSGEWKTVEISSLDFAGADGKGCGFRAADAGRAGDEYAGRTRFVSCSFKALSIGIERPYGQIGLWIEDCLFEGGDYHLYSRSVDKKTAERLHQDIMHSGVMFVLRSHFHGASQACILIDSQAPGTGQFLFEDCVMESNPGLVFDVRRVNGNGGFPGLCVRRCWNEANGKAMSGVYGRLANAAEIRFEDTPIGPLQLANVQVTTIDSALDLLTQVQQDSASSLVHVRARCSGDMEPQGLVRSIAGSTPNGPNRAPIFSIERPIAVSRGYADALLTSVMGDIPIVLVGSISRSTKTMPGAILPGQTKSLELDIAAGEQIFPPAISVKAGHWLAWTYIYRLLEGNVPEIRITGRLGVSASRQLSSHEWEILAGMAYIANGSDDLSIWHTLKNGRARINLGGLALLQFENAQAALEYLNAHTFPIAF